MLFLEGGLFLLEHQDGIIQLTRHVGKSDLGFAVVPDVGEQVWGVGAVQLGWPEVFLMDGQ